MKLLKTKNFFKNNRDIDETMDYFETYNKFDKVTLRADT